MTDRNEFFVYLVSNSLSSTNESYNTLSNFTNNFLNPIVLNNSENWRFALHSIFCNNQFENDQNGDNLKVSCDLISPLENQENTLAIIARKKSTFLTDKSKIYFEPDSKEYFIPNTTYINGINIKLHLQSATQSYIEGSRMFSGQPSVVVLHFMKFNMFSPDYIIRINSSKSYNEMYKQNTASHFRATLGRSYNFDPNSGDREVALSSITYQPNFAIDPKKELQLKLFDINSPKKQIWEGECVDFKGKTLTEYINYLNDEVFSKFSNICFY